MSKDIPKGSLFLVILAIGIGLLRLESGHNEVIYKAEMVKDMKRIPAAIKSGEYCPCVMPSIASMREEFARHIEDGTLSVRDLDTACVNKPMSHTTLNVVHG